MLIIRFMRTGKKGESKYRLVVKEQRDKRDGKPVEFLGSYEKLAGKKILKDLQMDRIKYWISQGAQLSNTAKKVTGL